MTTDRMPTPDKAKQDRRLEPKPRTERQQALAELRHAIPGAHACRPPHVPAPEKIRLPAVYNLASLPAAIFLTVFKAV